MDLYTDYVRPPKILEKGGGEVLVDRAGYVSVNKRIEAIIMAGERLHQARIDQYEFENGESVPDDYIDVTRNPGFDMADASQILNQLAEKAVRAAQTKVASEMSQPVSESASKAPPAPAGD